MTGIQLFVTVVLAGLTGWYAWQTHNLAESARRSAEAAEQSAKAVKQATEAQLVNDLLRDAGPIAGGFRVRATLPVSS